MSDFFRLAWEAADDSGAAPVGAPEPDEPEGDATPDTPEAAAPVTFTADQLAEHLPQFADRFLAHHDPTEALKLYGERDRNVQAALTRYTQGAPTDADLDTLREGGYEIPEQVEEPEEPAQPLWGAPWAEPTDYESFARLANERPDKAMAWIDKQPAGVVDEDTREQVLAYWEEHDRKGARAYEREHIRSAVQDETKSWTQEQLDALRSELAPVHQQHLAATNDARNAKFANLVNFAHQNVPEFLQHQDGVIEMIEKSILPAYTAQGRDPVQWFDEVLALSPEQQVKYLGQLTGAAAWGARPAVEAQAQAEAAAAETAKIAAGGQRGRGAASGGDSQSQAKRDFTASFERLKDVEVPFR